MSEERALLTVDDLDAMGDEAAGFELIDGKLYPTPTLFAPDLAIEVASPSKSDEELRLRTRLHLQGGTRQVWIVRPEQRTVTVFSADAPERTFMIDETLDGGDIVPGFTLPLASIFGRL
jgi:Uma2 family endonuclease